MELEWKYLDELYREKYFDKVVPPVYLKSEADKVIAELKGKLHDVSEILKETREWLIESQKLHKRCADNAIKVIRHHKYKRCLDKADYWGLLIACTHGLIQLKCMRREKKWREFAEKFKEAK
jgi:hypothetical protein